MQACLLLGLDGIVTEAIVRCLGLDAENTILGLYHARLRLARSVLIQAAKDVHRSDEWFNDAATRPAGLAVLSESAASSGSSTV